MLNDFGSSECTHSRASDEISITREASQKTRCKEIASASRVNELLNREGRYAMRLVARDDNLTLFRARHNAEQIFFTQRSQRCVKISGLIERAQLMLIGEHDIDRLVTDEP